MVDRPILRNFIIIARNMKSSRSASVISIAIAGSITNELSAMVVDGFLRISLMRDRRGSDSANSKTSYRSSSNRSPYTRVMHSTKLPAVTGKIWTWMHCSGRQRTILTLAGATIRKDEAKTDAVTKPVMWLRNLTILSLPTF